MTEILDTCRIWRDIDRHPLPENECHVDVKLSCGSILINCEYDLAYHWPVVFMEFCINKDLITQWRLSK